MRVVTYHFIRKFDTNFPFFKYLSFENFCRQLDFFENKYGFVKLEDFLSLCQKPSNFANFHRIKGKILLTFDDAYREHFTLVLPELKRRGLFGIFFIPTGIYQNKKVLDVHKIYYLLGKHGGKKLVTIGNFLAKDFSLKKVVGILRTNYDEIFFITEFKKFFNSLKNYSLREKFLNKIALELNEEEEKIFSEFYIAIEELKNIYKSQMIIGSHSVNHYILSDLDKKSQEQEIVKSFEFLENLFGTLEPKLFCYPYGMCDTFTNTTQKILENQRCDFSFSSESRDVELKDFLYYKQRLPRYDCSEFLFGIPTFGNLV
ncbi:polysaccharide deacetylase family protein [Helicobacter anatolicus]|uniref:polysaccharide deacetylase family protein n=1 Tax=Helicobacter anatolicus TaxID=2905874 RepID=UPI001E289942|nr:polysaccharide deacetylase family protein [Helicobacter anatolicus]MCE3039427.1 polysaccharide deacetylase family protein [Helicobacter anatolicus]